MQYAKVRLREDNEEENAERRKQNDQSYQFCRYYYLTKLMGEKYEEHLKIKP